MAEGWEALDPPSFAATGGSLEAYSQWLRLACIGRSEPLALGGHSLGAALAVVVAAEGEVAVRRLVLVNPAGLPLSKPAPLMLFDFLRRVACGWFPPREAARSAAQVLSHPRCALRLGRQARGLNLSEQLDQLRRQGIPCTVVGVRTDTLTPPELCRQIATLAGGEYRELDVEGGHLWFLKAPRLLHEHLAHLTGARE
jgi:pimeloyl-ACP methyl ester carboxylesterase